MVGSTFSSPHPLMWPNPKINEETMISTMAALLRPNPPSRNLRESLPFLQIAAMTAMGRPM